MKVGSYFHISNSGSGGRAARQRSAKPRTAVRIRSRPQDQQASFVKTKGALFFLAHDQNPF